MYVATLYCQFNLVGGIDMNSTDQYSEEDFARVTVGERQEHNATIYLADYDVHWQDRYLELNRIVTEALGDKVLLLEHVGSTSVPGLAAKPVIDMVLEVTDSDREVDYVPALESQAFVLRIREPDWFAHRLLKLDDVNLHVFSNGCSESTRMIRFRDWLRSHPEERDLYLNEKRQLASQVWKHVQNYADAKSAIVEAILSRAMANDPQS